MNTILLGWPWLTIPLAVVLLAALWRASGPARWRDPGFVLGLLWPMYLLHQFEEHGVDALGRRYAFLGDMCRTLGHDTLATCPADAAFVFVVNVVACQFIFASTFGWRTRAPTLAAFGWSVPLVNGLAHVAGAIKNGAYNPGLATSVLLFLPLGVVMLRASLRAGVLRGREVPMVFGAGVLLHAVLLGSVLLRGAGAIGQAAFLAINALNGLVPLGAGQLALRLRPRV